MYFVALLYAKYRDTQAFEFTLSSYIMSNESVSNEFRVPHVYFT